MPEDPEQPELDFRAEPSTMAPGDSTLLIWTARHATACAAEGGWNGEKEVEGIENTHALTASRAYILSCTGAGGAIRDTVSVTVIADLPAPTVTLTAAPATVAAGSAATLSWASTHATGCAASGSWSGDKAVSGNQKSGLLTVDARFVLTCTGPGGKARDSASVTVTQPPPKPTLKFSADPLTVPAGGSATLTWTSAHADGCEATGQWSGARPAGGSQSTGSLSAPGVFVLACAGPGGTVKDSLLISVTPITGGSSGLDFPSNGQTAGDIRFRFAGANLIPMYPATYIWRVNLRRQSGYYTTFFWGPDGAFTGNSYYGCHPYPDGDPKPASREHKWELSIDGKDIVDDANGHSTQLGYDTWRLQGFRAFDDGSQKIHEFYWDLPDTTKVIRVAMHKGYGTPPPANPALTFGTAPWAIGTERLSGILRGLQLYSAPLSLQDLIAETGAPLSTAAGEAEIWYLNLNPVPGDISDKSGKGHHPEWISAARPGLWTGP